MKDCKSNLHTKRDNDTSQGANKESQFFPPDSSFLRNLEFPAFSRVIKSIVP